VRLYKSEEDGLDGGRLIWDWVEPISYGYDNDGMLVTMMAHAQYQGRVRLVEFEPPMIDDLMANYSASAIPGTATEYPEED